SQAAVTVEVAGRLLRLVLSGRRQTRAHAQLHAQPYEAAVSDRDTPPLSPREGASGGSAEPTARFTVRVCADDCHCHRPGRLGGGRPTRSVWRTPRSCGSPALGECL